MTTNREGEAPAWLRRATDDELRAEVTRRHLRFADEVNMALLQVTIADARSLSQEVARLKELLDIASQT